MAMFAVEANKKKTTQHGRPVFENFKPGIHCIYPNKNQGCWLVAKGSQAFGWGDRVTPGHLKKFQENPGGDDSITSGVFRGRRSKVFSTAIEQ